MYFINKIVPSTDQLWFADQTEGFKKIFKLENLKPSDNSQQGWDFMTAYRPFGTHLWINDTEVDFTEYMKRPYFKIGNRPALSSIPELED